MSYLSLSIRAEVGKLLVRGQIVNISVCEDQEAKLRILCGYFYNLLKMEKNLLNSRTVQYPAADQICLQAVVCQIVSRQ